jgi:hypothetical protein
MQLEVMKPPVPRLLRRIGRVVTDFTPKECKNFFATQAVRT